MESVVSSPILHLPAEVMYNVLEHVQCLDDFQSISLTSRWMADLCRNIPAKTLWWTTVRSCDMECWSHETCWCGLVKPALTTPKSRPFKVRAWLYRRACWRSFGVSGDALEDVLEACQVDVREPFNPYDVESETEGPWLDVESDTDSEYERRVRVWNTIWATFTRYLTMQRVQRLCRALGRVRELEGTLEVMRSLANALEGADGSAS